MSPDSRLRSVPKLARGLGALALLAVVALTLAGLSRFGIWDPWELAVADRARDVLRGSLPADSHVPLSTHLVALGFQAFGMREWAGRLPIAIAGIAALVTAFWTATHFAGKRAGLYTALALGTTPFFLLHARLMLGATPTFLASGLVLLGTAAAVFPGATPPSEARPWTPYAWLGLALAGAGVGTLASGVLLSVAPPLVAVAIVALQLGSQPRESRARTHARWGVIAAATFCSLMVVRAVLRREADYSAWLGGSPLDPSVPTYERAIEQLFHSFAPWSALLPLALASLLRLGADRPDRPLRLLCVLWAALAYAAQTIFLSSYGSAVFPAPIALAAAVAIWLCDREEEPGSYWPEAITGLLLLGLVIRDYALYPASPLGSLGLSDPKLPADFNPRGAWAATLGAVGVGLVLSCMATPDNGRSDLRAPYRGIGRLFRTSIGHKAWLILAALLWAGLLIFGALSFTTLIPLTSLAQRIGKALALIPIGLPVAVALGQLGYAYSPRLAPMRHLPLLAGSIGLAAYTSQVFQPQLSAQFSPRGVFDAYNELATGKEPLAQQGVESGAASYYAKSEVRELKSRAELIDYLSQPGRRWAAFPADQLSDVDVAFRERTGRHLYVPPSDNGRVMLAASEPVHGKPNTNPLGLFVVSKVPPMQHEVGGNFEDKIELVGYSLELPGKDHVGAGQSFKITWIWRALQRNLGDYQIFVHIDAPNQRINGDHEPVDGKYRVRLWDEGDVIIDRQEVSVPATSRPGVYTLYVGFYRGDSRLKVVKGQQDGENRLQAGRIEVR